MNVANLRFQKGEISGQGSVFGLSWLRNLALKNRYNILTKKKSKKKVACFRSLFRTGGVCLEKNKNRLLC